MKIELPVSPQYSSNDRCMAAISKRDFCTFVAVVRSALCLLTLLVTSAVAQTPPDSGVGQGGEQSGVPRTPVAVSSLAALKEALPAASVAMQRLGYSAPGDGGAMLYNWSWSKCSLESGAGDNGAQVAPSRGTGCWLADFSIVPATPKIWGAKCDGSTDDTAAFRAMVAWVNMHFGPTTQIRMPANAICIVDLSAGPLLLTQPVDWEGYGVPGSGAGLTIGSPDGLLTGTSVLRDTSRSGNAILAYRAAAGPIFKNFMIDAVPTQSRGGRGISIEGNSALTQYTRNTQIEGMQFRGLYDAVYNAYAVWTTITLSYFLDYYHCGIVYDQNTGLDPDSFDYGDWRVLYNQFFDLSVSTGSGFCHLMGSGGSFAHNTVNGGWYGYYMSWNGSHSEETRIIGNIMDQQSRASIGLFQGSTKSDFSELIISNNNFSTQAFDATSGQNPVYGNIYAGVGTPAEFDPSWLKGISINNNTFNNCYNNHNGARAWIWLKTASGLIVSNNIGWGNTSPGSCNSQFSSGVSMIRLEGNTDPAAGVVGAKVLDNQLFMAAYTPKYDAVMSPTSIINDESWHTYATDPTIGYNRTIDRVIDLTPLNITSWKTVLTLVPSTQKNLVAVGEIRAMLNAHTTGVSSGSNDAAWRYYYNGLGGLTVARQRADQTFASIGNAPQFRLVQDASNNIAIQVQSSNAVAAITGGFIHLTMDAGGPRETPVTGFYWTLE